MSPNLRKTIYALIAVLNAVLLGCVQQNLIPPAFSTFALVASLAMAAGMKEFNSVNTSPTTPAEVVQIAEATVKAQEPVAGVVEKPNDAK